MRNFFDSTTIRLYHRFMKSRDLINLLKDNGWVLERIEGSHHIFKKAGNPYSISVPVHKGKDIKTGTALAILKEAGIQK